MRVIFLDIDGVLNSTKTSLANGGFPFKLTEYEAFDMQAVKLLQRFCDSTGIVIVISSYWRLENEVEDFCHHLGLPVIDRTPHFPGRPRGEEIQHWLDNHPEVTEYCIIDDDADMLEHHTEFLVHTNGNEGFTYANYIMMCNIFDENPFQGEARKREWRVKWREDEIT